MSDTTKRNVWDILADVKTPKPTRSNSSGANQPTSTSGRNVPSIFVEAVAQNGRCDGQWLLGMEQLKRKVKYSSAEQQSVSSNGTLKKQRTRESSPVLSRLCKKLKLDKSADMNVDTPTVNWELLRSCNESVNELCRHNESCSNELVAESRLVSTSHVVSRQVDCINSSTMSNKLTLTCSALFTSQAIHVGSNDTTTTATTTMAVSSTANRLSHQSTLCLTNSDGNISNPIACGTKSSSSVIGVPLPLPVLPVTSVPSSLLLPRNFFSDFLSSSPDLAKTCSKMSVPSSCSQVAVVTPATLCTVNSKLSTAHCTLSHGAIKPATSTAGSTSQGSVVVPVEAHNTWLLPCVSDITLVPVTTRSTSVVLVPSTTDCTSPVPFSTTLGTDDITLVTTRSTSVVLVPGTTDSTSPVPSTTTVGTVPVPITSTANIDASCVVHITAGTAAAVDTVDTSLPVVVATDTSYRLNSTLLDCVSDESSCDSCQSEVDYTQNICGDSVIEKLLCNFDLLTCCLVNVGYQTLNNTNNSSQPHNTLHLQSLQMTDNTTPPHTGTLSLATGSSAVLYLPALQMPLELNSFCVDGQKRFLRTARPTMLASPTLPCSLPPTLPCSLSPSLPCSLPPTLPCSLPPTDTATCEQSQHCQPTVCSSLPDDINRHIDLCLTLIADSKSLSETESVSDSDSESVEPASPGVTNSPQCQLDTCLVDSVNTDVQPELRLSDTTNADVSELCLSDSVNTDVQPELRLSDTTNADVSELCLSDSVNTDVQPELRLSDTTNTDVSELCLSDSVNTDVQPELRLSDITNTDVSELCLSDSVNTDVQPELRLSDTTNTDVSELCLSDSVNTDVQPELRLSDITNTDVSELCLSDSVNTDVQPELRLSDTTNTDVSELCLSDSVNCSLSTDEGLADMSSLDEPVNGSPLVSHTGHFADILDKQLGCSNSWLNDAVQVERVLNSLSQPQQPSSSETSVTDVGVLLSECTSCSPLSSSSVESELLQMDAKDHELLQNSCKLLEIDVKDTRDSCCDDDLSPVVSDVETVALLSAVLDSTCLEQNSQDALQDVYNSLTFPQTSSVDDVVSNYDKMASVTLVSDSCQYVLEMLTQPCYAVMAYGEQSVRRVTSTSIEQFSVTDVRSQLKETNCCCVGTHNEASLCRLRLRMPAKLANSFYTGSAAVYSCAVKLPAKRRFAPETALCNSITADTQSVAASTAAAAAAGGGDSDADACLNRKKRKLSKLVECGELNEISVTDNQLTANKETLKLSKRVNNVKDISSCSVDADRSWESCTLRIINRTSRSNSSDSVNQTSDSNRLVTLNASSVLASCAVDTKIHRARQATLKFEKTGVTGQTRITVNKLETLEQMSPGKPRSPKKHRKISNCTQQKLSFGSSKQRPSVSRCQLSGVVIDCDTSCDSCDINRTRNIDADDSTETESLAYDTEDYCVSDVETLNAVEINSTNTTVNTQTKQKASTSPSTSDEVSHMADIKPSPELKDANTISPGLTATPTGLMDTGTNNSEVDAIHRLETIYNTSPVGSKVKLKRNTARRRERDGKICDSNINTRNKENQHNSTGTKQRNVRKRCSLLAELANSEGYVADKKISQLPANNCNTMSREERAVQMALMRIHAMEVNAMMSMSRKSRRLQTDKETKIYRRRVNANSKSGSVRVSGEPRDVGVCEGQLAWARRSIKTHTRRSQGRYKSRWCLGDWKNRRSKRRQSLRSNTHNLRSRDKQEVKQVDNKHNSKLSVVTVTHRKSLGTSNRKQSSADVNRKQSSADVNRKQSSADVNRKQSSADVNRKQSSADVNRKQSSADVNRKQSSADVNRKQSSADVNRKQSSADVNRKQSSADVNRKQSSADVNRKQSSADADKMSIVSEPVLLNKHCHVTLSAISEDVVIASRLSLPLSNKNNNNLSQTHTVHKLKGPDTCEINELKRPDSCEINELKGLDTCEINELKRLDTCELTGQYKGQTPCQTSDTSEGQTPCQTSDTSEGQTPCQRTDATWTGCDNLSDCSGSTSDESQELNTECSECSEELNDTVDECDELSEVNDSGTLSQELSVSAAQLQHPNCIKFITVELTIGPIDTCSASVECTSELNTSSLTSACLPAEVRRISVEHNTGETVLHKAARLGYLNVVYWCCVTHYVDVNVRNNANYTPLHESCASGHTLITRCLIQHGADINCVSRLDGARPLHDAVEADSIETVRLLLSLGADVTMTTYSGQTVLHLAKSIQMKHFLEAYLDDLNGVSSLDSVSDWNFESSWTCDSDLLCDIPSDDDDVDCDGLSMECSQQLFLPTYFLQINSCSDRLEKFVLLADVLALLSITHRVFTSRYDIRVHCLSWQTFQSQTMLADFDSIKQRLHCISLDRSTVLQRVELLHLSDKLRRILNIETVNL